MKNKAFIFLTGLTLLAVPFTAVHADDEQATSPPTIVEEVPSDLEASSDNSEVSTLEDNVRVTIEKVLLDYCPEDLSISFPKRMDLVAKNNGFGFEDVIHVSTSGENDYEVVVRLKDTNVSYVSEEDPNLQVSGVANINGSDSYTWLEDDLLADKSVPLSVFVYANDLSGRYSTNLSFSVDVYQYIETAIEKEPTEEVNQDTTMTISSGMITADTFADYPLLQEVNISKDVEAIEASAFDNLTDLQVINYAGTKEAWENIYSGTYSGVVNFAEVSKEPTKEVANEVENEVVEDETNEDVIEEVTEDEVIGEDTNEVTENTEPTDEVVEEATEDTSNEEASGVDITEEVQIEQSVEEIQPEVEAPAPVVENIIPVKEIVTE